MWKFLDNIDKKSSKAAQEIDKSVIFQSKTVYFHIQNIFERMIKYYAFNLGFSKSFIDSKARETLRFLITKPEIKSSMLNDGFDVSKIDRIADKANKIKHTKNIITFEIEEVIDALKCLHDSGMIILRKVKKKSSEVFNSEYYRIIARQKSVGIEKNSIKKTNSNTKEYIKILFENSKDEIFVNFTYQKNLLFKKLNYKINKTAKLNRFLIATLTFCIFVGMLIFSNNPFPLSNPYFQLLEASQFDACYLDECEFYEERYDSNGDVNTSLTYTFNKLYPMIKIKMISYAAEVEIESNFNLLLSTKVISIRTSFDNQFVDTYINYNFKYAKEPCYNSKGIMVESLKNYEDLYIDNINNNQISDENLCFAADLAFQFILNDFPLPVFEENSTIDIDSMFKYYHKKNQIYNFIERYL